VISPTLFLKFVSVTFQKQITYRFDYFIGILNGFLYVFIFTSVWRALFSQSDNAMQAGFTMNGMITYAVIAMVVRISFTQDDTVIYKKVQDGSVSIDLIRPVSFFFMNLAESTGYSLFHFFARSVPILIISLFLFEIEIPFEPARLFAFALSALFGYLILFLVNFSVGLLAFWFIEIFPFMLFKYGLLTLFGGGIVPVDFFPDALKVVINLLPFQQILYVPTVILTGHAPLDSLPALLSTQFAWVVLMTMVSKTMWSAGRNKLVVQGG
jgi:ABC-2 type transport system permease protein